MVTSQKDSTIHRDSSLQVHQNGEVVLDPSSFILKKGQNKIADGDEKEREAKRLNDSWELPELTDIGPKWSELDTSGKVKSVVFGIFKAFFFIVLLYMFICSLDLLSSAFRLIGGKSTGDAFQNTELMHNPIVGVMLGVLVTVIVQSSSTSTSIVVTMVAGGFMPVKMGIPIVMGANIGTSVTSTIVAMTQVANRNEFRRAFAASGVLNVFNWLTMFILLPIEVTTGYLLALTTAIVDSFTWTTDKEADVDLLKTLTHHFVEHLIKLDREVLNGWSVKDPKFNNSSLVLRWCEHKTVYILCNVTKNETLEDGSYFLNVSELNVTIQEGTVKCPFLFNIDIADIYIGLIILLLALLMLCGGLVLLVKALHSVMHGSMAKVIKHSINANIPYVPWLTGYIAILIGTGMTFLLQSSSVFTSALVPLVGVGVISLERVYPLMLGSNIGTTTTSLLAAMTASGDRLKPAIQMSLCHLFFNISGILLFYPIPFLRLPLPMAKMLGDTTSKYRWFAVLFLLLSFLLLPAFLVALSIGGEICMYAIGLPILILIILIVVINIMQNKCPRYLPMFIRTWDWLPEWLHSLEPWDRKISKLSCCKRFRTKSGSVLVVSEENSVNGISNPSFNADNNC